MLRSLIVPLALLAATAAAADPGPVPTGRETRIPRIYNFLEWVPDGQRGIFVRGDTGKWYYARTQVRCPRLRPTANISFFAPNGELDRFGGLRIEGWRCALVSVVESGPPPGRESR